jgi:NADPH-dependent curcumin reductase CurA
MKSGVNQQIILASRPVGWPKESDFRLEETPIPEPGASQILVRNVYMSVDPYMRGRMRDVKSYAPPFEVGQPMTGRAVGQVVRSRHPGFAEGAYVRSMLGWREYFVSSGEGIEQVDTGLAPLSCFLGVLGLPGFTGWYGLKEIGKPRAGETLVVSGAAGATGSLVGQLGKLLGCRVVGTAGSDDKCAYLVKDLGLDAAIDYKRAGDLYEALREACPGGIDVYYENVGGPMLDAVLRLLNPFSRIVLCGLISQYNLETPDPGPRYLFSMIRNRTLMRGFIITDHLDREPEFIREVGGWLTAGKIKHEETIVEGIEYAPQAFLGLFKGENRGKMLVKIGPAPE